MDIDLIAKIILYLPTGLFALMVLFGFLRGLMRGMKKSFYALISMLIAVGVCILIPMMVSVDFILGLLDKYLGTGITSLSEYIAEALQASGFVASDVSLEAICSYASMSVKLILFLVCLITIYYLVRIILHIFYLVFFRSRVRDYNEEYGKNSLIGGLIGILRGAILGFLLFSQFSTLYCIVAGGVFYNEDEYQSIEANGEVWEYDEIYKALKTSRSFGISAFFDNISGEDGTPLDYLLMDFVASSSYKDLNGEKVTIKLREELTGVTGIAAALLDHGIIGIGPNFTIVVNYENINDESINQVLNSLGDMKLVTDVLPTLLIDFLNSSTDFNIDPALLKDLDLKNDFVEIANIVTQIFTILDFSNEDMFADIDWFDLDEELVDSIIHSISNITLLTKFALPIGTEYLIELLESGDDPIINDLLFNFDSILWDEEIQNLEGLYGLIKQLNWDVLLGDDLDIFEDVLGNEDTLAIVDKIIQQVFNSDLIFGITKSALSTFVVAALDETGYTEGLEIDFTNFTKEQLKEDVSILIATIVDGKSLFDIFTGDDFSTDDIFNIDVEPVRKMFLGYANENNVYIKGFLDLNILNCMDINNLLTNIITISLEGVIELPYIGNWKDEFGYLFDLITNIQTSGIDLPAILEGDYTSFSSMSEEAQSGIINSIVDSTIMSSVIVSTISQTEALDIPQGLQWYGRDGELHALLTGAFHLVSLDLLDILMNGGDISILLESLTANDFDIVLDSVILHSTISGVLISVSEENEMLVIPDEALDNSGITEGMVSKSEIVNLMDVILNLGIDFETFDFSTVKLFTDENIDGINTSIILSRSVVVLIEGQLSSSLSIPDIGEDWYNSNQELSKLLYAFQALLGKDATMSSFENFALDIQAIIDNSSVILNSSIFNILVSDVLLDIDFIEIPNSIKETSYNYVVVEKQALVDLLDSISLLGITDLESFDINALFADGIDYNELFNSFILVASVSNIIEQSSLFAYVPNELKDNDYILKSELVSILTAIRAIGITDLDNTNELDLNAIMSNSNLVFASDLLWITVSDMIADVVGDLPSSVIENKFSIDLITKTELNVLFGILVDIGVTDLDSLNIDTLLAQDPDKLMASAILSSMLSNVIIDSNAFSIPLIAMDGDYVKTSELIKLLTSFKLLGITNFDNISLSLTELMKHKDSFDAILDSLILRNTLSDTILVAGLDIVFDYYDTEVIENISVINGEYDYVLTSYEIKSLLLALDVLGANDYADIVIDINTITNLTDEEVNTLLNSSIICVLLSDLCASFPTQGNYTTQEALTSDGAYVDIYTKVALSEMIAAVRV